MKINKIMVVDDEESIRKLFKTLLTKEGYTVITAESSEEALEILENQAIHVMFLDIKLSGISGIELCKKIKFNKPASICIAVTGYSSIFELTNCREAGFDDYFLKPVKLDLIIKAAADSFEKLERWKRKYNEYSTKKP